MRLFIYCMCLCFLSGCQSSESKTKFESVEVNKEVPVQSKKAPKVSKPNKYAKMITNQNVIQRLKTFGKSNPETRILIETTFGNIKLRLYEDTPLHRANFIMLIKKGFYDSTLFYRVINHFMIQGGNSDDNKMFNRIAQIGNYKIPSEIMSHISIKEVLLLWLFKNNIIKMFQNRTILQVLTIFTLYKKVLFRISTWTD